MAFNCTLLYCVRDNNPWWANVHCNLNLTINKLSYSYLSLTSVCWTVGAKDMSSISYVAEKLLCNIYSEK